MSEKPKYQLQCWKLLIEEKNHSGMTVLEWCKANGLSRYSYYYWLEKLREEKFLEAVQKCADERKQDVERQRKRAAPSHFPAMLQNQSNIPTLLFSLSFII